MSSTLRLSATTDAAANAVDENATNGTVVGVTAFASDADATTNTITYSLDDNAAGRFAIDGSTGVVTVADGSLLDREAAASHDITVRATSADGSFSQQSYTIALNDVDEFDVTAISDTDAAADTVAEDATIGDAVGITAQASDADATTNAITYTLDDDAGGRFAINGSTGLVTVNAALDYETYTSHSVTVRATSADGSSSTQSYTISVTDVNESGVTPIVDNDATMDSVTENAAIGSTVGVTAFSDDADGSDTITYSLDDNDGGRFAIDAGTGIVTVAGSIDREADGASRSITVRATSTDGSFQTRTFTIGVVDENDTPPVIAAGQSLSVTEDAQTGVVVGSVAATDADSIGSLQGWVILAGNADSVFSIDSNSGEITIADPTRLDFETTASHTLTLLVSDGVNNSANEAVTINIIDVDELPQGALPESPEEEGDVTGEEEPPLEEAENTGDDEDDHPTTERLQTSQIPAVVLVPDRQVREGEDGAAGEQTHDVEQSYAAPTSVNEEQEQAEEDLMAFALTERQSAISEDQAAAANENISPEPSDIGADAPDSHVFWGDSTLDTGFLRSQLEIDSTITETDTLEETLAVGSATVTITALSAGYLLWMLRGGSLLGSFLSSLPAWRMLDPLPILEEFHTQPAAAGCSDDDEDEDSLQAMLAGSR